MLRIAINGFGRIGRLSLRAALEAGAQDITFVAINDLGDAATNAHLLRYDSTHGSAPFEVEQNGDDIHVEGHHIKSLSEREPRKLPWKELEVDVVIESTGIFTDREKAAGHLEAGARKVLISGPSGNADATIVCGVNDGSLAKAHDVISNASCTTNCIAPVAMVLKDHCGIKSGHMTTIHAYTGDQSILDVAHKDLRRARSAALSMIPTSTGAAKAIALVMPELDGKIKGTSVRVPVPNVSLVDLVIQAEKSTSIEDVNDAFTQAAEGKLRSILEVNSAPLVSIDFNHCSASAVADLTQTNVIKGDLVRVLAWYDNEWGFAHRMIDVAKKLGALI